MRKKYEGPYELQTAMWQKMTGCLRTMPVF